MWDVIEYDNSRFYWAVLTEKKHSNSVYALCKGIIPFCGNFKQ